MSAQDKIRVGVIGAGQLARMMVPPAIALGIDISVLAEAPEMSAKRAADRVPSIVLLDGELVPAETTTAVSSPFGAAAGGAGAALAVMPFYSLIWSKEILAQPESGATRLWAVEVGGSARHIIAPVSAWAWLAGFVITIFRGD